MPVSTKKVYKRNCALASCGEPFESTDRRKLYHTRRCMATAVQQRWLDKARKAIRAQERRRRAA